MKLNLLLTAVFFCAGNAWCQSHCTAQTVKGNFALFVDGTVISANTPITGPFMRIGEMTLDGVGVAAVSTLGIYNGINFGQETYSGTYSVTGDCQIIFHFFLPTPVNANTLFQGPVGAGGSDVVFMLIQAPLLNTGVGFGRRRTIANCSAGDLGGSWSFELNGYRNLPPFGSGTLYRQTGQIQADGRGGLTASFLTNNNGVITPETGRGTYTVAADCTFDLNYLINGSPYSVRGSLISNDEAYTGLNMPGPAAPGGGVLTGAVAPGTMVRQTFLSHE